MQVFDWRVRVKWRFVWLVMHDFQYKKFEFQQACDQLEALGVPPLSAWIMISETLHKGYSPHMDWP